MAAGVTLSFAMDASCFDMFLKHFLGGGFGDLAGELVYNFYCRVRAVSLVRDNDVAGYSHG